MKHERARERITILLTETEKRRLQEYCRDNEVTVSEYIRSRIRPAVGATDDTERSPMEHEHG
jgi:hypothetical protein